MPGPFHQYKSTTTLKPTTLPACKRYITTHDAAGRSVFHSAPAQIYRGRDGKGGQARSYAVASVPATLANDADIKAYLSGDGVTSHTGPDIVSPTGRGMNLIVIDLAPGGESQLHQTVSVDFSVCVQGSVRCALDSGDEVTLFPGDHVIQRGTMHKWYNASQTEPARFLGITIPCEPFDIGGGKMLVEEHVQGTGPRRRDGSRL